MDSDDHVVAARRVFDSATDVIVDFTGTTLSAATEAPLDLAALARFVRLVGPGSEALVADVGCGPGRVAASLAKEGLRTVGFDVSTAMLAAARRAHPHLRFEEGRLDALPLDDGVLAGAVCWYSIQFTPLEKLEAVWAELARVLTEPGYLLVAFQAGQNGPVHRMDAHGTGLALTRFEHRLDDVTSRLEGGGFSILETVLRDPEFDHETCTQAIVIARIG